MLKIFVLIATVIVMVDAIVSPPAAHAATKVDHVKVQWSENGQQKEQDFPPGSSNTISRDSGTQVDVIVYRTSNSGSVNYWCTDFNNGISDEHGPTTGSWWFFGSCVGSGDTQVWAGVDTTEGRVELLIFNQTPQNPDLIVSSITVDGTTLHQTYSVGQTIDLDAIVWNVGEGEAGTSKLGYYIGTSSNDTSNRWQTDHVTSLSMDEGDSESAQYTFTNSDAGTRYFVLRADYLDDVEEGNNEHNNGGSFGPFTVVIPCTPVGLSLGIHGGSGSTPTASPGPNCGSGYESGTVVSLTASPATGWQASHWHGTANDGSKSTSNGVTIPVSGTLSVNVHYEQIPCTPVGLSLGIHGGSGSTPTASPGPNCGSGYESGTVVSLTASPATGWQASHWHGTANDGSKSTSNGVTIPVSGTLSVNVHYEQIPCTPVGLSLGIHGGSGSTPTASPGPNCGSGYESGTVVSLTASPATGWQASHWHGTANDGSKSTSNGVTIPVSGTLSVNVHYEQIPCTPVGLSLGIHGGSGSTPTASPGPNCGSGYESGTVVSLTASPATGWQASHWHGTANDGSKSTSNGVTIPVSGTLSVNVHYEQIPCTPVGLSLGIHGGSGSTPTASPGPNCGSGYESGTVVSLTASPATGWQASHWHGTANDGSKSTSNGVTIPVSGTLSVNVHYEEAAAVIFSVEGQVMARIWPNELTDPTTLVPIPNLYVRVRDRDVILDDEYLDGITTTDSDGNYKTADLDNSDKDPQPDPEGEPYVFAKLEGPWVKVIDVGFLGFGFEPEHDFDIAVVNGRNFHDWIWSAEDEVNLFYHVNRAHDYFASPLFDFELMDWQMVVEYDKQVGLLWDLENAHATGLTLEFGTVRPFSRSSDVIVHEFTHNVVRQVYGGRTIRSLVNNISEINEARAMSEGLADYFAASLNERSGGDACFACDVGVNRDLEQAAGDKRFDNSQDFDAGPGGSHHKNSQVLSGALWDLREMIGPDSSDQLIFGALRQNNPTSFQGLLLAIIETDISLNNEIYRSAIIDSFSNHGIFLPPPPDTASAASQSQLIDSGAVFDSIDVINDSLIRIWSFDNLSKSWSFYDPRNAFAHANSISKLRSGQIYWVNVDKNQEAVLNSRVTELTLGWNLISW